MVIQTRMAHYPLFDGLSGFRKRLDQGRMARTEKVRVRSLDADEVAKAVAAVYCPHSAVFKRTATRAPTVFEIRHTGAQPIAELRYGAPVVVDAGEFPRLLLIQSCLEGSGSARQGGSRAALNRGQTVPLSPGLATQLEFDARFAQRSVRLDLQRVEAVCARMLGHPLDRPLRFDLQPFSASLEKAWTEAVGLVMNYAQMNIALPRAAAASLDEFLISLVLTQHAHNYTAEIQGRTNTLPPRLVREAEHLMRMGSSDLTVSAIAAQLKVSLRSLEASFREHRRMTPTQCLRMSRLARVREALRSPDASTSVTSAALANGFLHLARFSAYYKAAFGEYPAQTLRTNRGRSHSLSL